MNIVGHIENKTAIIIDDIIDTAGTLQLAGDALMKHGAKEVYACATHPVLSGPAISRLETHKLKKLSLLTPLLCLKRRRFQSSFNYQLAR